MKPLIVLIVSFIISVFIIKLLRNEYEFYLSARIALSSMLAFTALGHFMFIKGMSMMVPEFIPFKQQIVYLTGFLEIGLAIGLLIPSFRCVSGWILIVLLIIMFPANIYASIHHIDYQKGTFEGDGLEYLWFRVPLQVLFILWSYISAVRN